LILALLFALALLVLSVWLDNAALTSQPGIIGFAGQWAAWAVRGVVGFAAIFATFAYLKNRQALADISARAASIPIRRTLLAVHFLLLSVFCVFSWALYGNYLTAATPANVIFVAWLVTGMSGIACGACSIAPLGLWAQLIRSTGWLWAYTLTAIIAACFAGFFGGYLWAPAAELTFTLAKAFISPFVTGVVADPSAKLLGTPAFTVQIAPECSGFEGAGLILAFGVMWLVLFRRECRFPQALVLIPAGVAAMFLLNAVRIAALILIGSAGAERIAAGGFHSQAGWICFNVVALAFSIAARRIPWLNNNAPSAVSAKADPATYNPTASYLLPFLAILATGMVTNAASAGFEWLYPARLVAVVTVLWVLRRNYKALDWHITWFGPAIGVAVFAVWIAFDLMKNVSATDAMPEALLQSDRFIRVAWIVLRVISAVVTVPIAEELAFRGFLLRRFVSENFESLPLTQFTWLGLAVSSVAFGALHGGLWFPGILAGLLYAWALVRRGRLGDAVVAHATTNALLAAYVLLFQKWHLW